MRAILLASCLLVGACRSEAAAPACAADEALVEGRCTKPLACDDLSVATADGCVRVGVGACVDGFVPDGEGGCEPVLPPTLCPKGLMAIPGEKVCREIMPCGTGTWGAIPVEPNTLYVDRSYTGTDADGSQAHPFPRIGDAVDAAFGTRMIAVAAGVYEETLTISRPVRLFGRCPSMVELRGGSAGDAFSAPLLLRDTVEVRGIAFTGPAVGVIAGATGGRVILDRVWIHDTGVSGLLVARKGIDTAITLRDSLIENALEYGALLAEVTGTLERSVIRGTRSRTSDGKEGQGLAVNGPAAKLPSDVTVVRSVIEGNHTQNVYASGSVVRIDSSVIRLGLPRTDLEGGIGMELEGCQLTVVDSAIVDNRLSGVDLLASSGVFDRTTVARTLPGNGGIFGGGVFAASSYLSGKPSTELTFRDSSLHDVRTFGIMTYGCPIVLERCRLAHVKAQESDGLYGDAVMATAHALTESSPKLESPTRILRALVLDVARAGVSVWATQLSVSEARLSCTAFDIELGRSYLPRLGTRLEGDYTIEDLGGSTCGCKGTDRTCRATATSLSPVPPPPPPLGR